MPRGRRLFVQAHVSLGARAYVEAVATGAFLPLASGLDELVSTRVPSEPLKWCPLIPAPFCEVADG